jgi:predicted nucleic acid-binding protein
VTKLSARLLLDTNVFILGFLHLDSPEGQLLQKVVNHPNLTLILSNELVEQIRHVARRVGGKDWAGYLLSQIWTDYLIEYVNVSLDEKRELQAQGYIPREDVGIYLTALRGRAECFVSANSELVKQAAIQQSLFECLTPDQFLQKYLYKLK